MSHFLRRFCAAPDALRRVARLALAFACACAMLFVAANARAQDYAPGRVLVRWKPLSKSAARNDAMAPLGAMRVASYEFAGLEALSVPGMDPAEAAARLSQDPRVEYAEPDYLVSIGRTPDDPRYPEQFGLHNAGQTGGLAGADIGADRAWEFYTGEPSLLVADIDTGCDYDHEDLAANIWTNPGEVAGNGIDDDRNGYIDDVHGYDFYGHDGDPRDDNGHGTHTAGTIAAVGNNGVGVTGVVWQAKLVILKFLNANGSGPTSGAIEAIGYCVRNGIRLSNNSWNGGFYSRALEDAISAAGDAGHLFVAAAGNARTDNDAAPSYPAALPADNIITVAATDHADQLAGFSNYGLTSVDLAAPGADILSTVPNNGYHLLSGTSMAAPHVTGAAAFLMGRFPQMAIADVKARLLFFAEPKPGLIGRCVTGGRLNLALAAADADSIAPSRPQGLRVASVGSNSVELAWTAPGDDSTAGTAATYELRVAVQPITPANFAQATLFASPRPRPAQSAELFRMRGLATEATYFVALRARDEFGNPGAISNVVTFTTLAAPNLVLPTPTVDAATRTGITLTRTVELRNPSAGVLEWSAPRPVLDFGTPAPVVAAWPDEPTAKGTVGSAHEPQTAGAGGPDAGGYRWIDSDEPAGPAFQWVDIVSPANAITLSGDEAMSAPLPLGFSFPLYGRRFSQLRVCTNGYLQFGNEGPVFVNVGLPGTGAARNLIAPFWDDLSFGTGVKRAYLHFDGARTIVTWNAVPRFNDAGSVFTFQAILYPSGEVRFQYRRMTGSTTQATIGLQDSTRALGTTIAFNQAYVHDSLAVRVVPLVQWLEVSPAAGVIGPGESQTLTLSMVANGLASGTYRGRVRLTTNDGSRPDTAIAVSLAVQGAPDITAAPAALDFGAHSIGARDTLHLTIANTGVDPLHVSGLSVTHSAFHVAADGFTLLPGDTRALAVVFAPTEIAEAVGELRMASDDPDQPLLALPLRGVGSAAPVLELVATSLVTAAAPTLGEHAAQRERAIVLYNPGGAPLQWTASAYQGVV
ncbi:MAG: S8 family serine peptidase, partial [Candidatus Eisenbacteria bacterium]|nr:S8 family serine peptidase [Candidatus Eisenbacteria bacterium]